MRFYTGSACLNDVERIEVTKQDGMLALRVYSRSCDVEFCQAIMLGAALGRDWSGVADQSISAGKAVDIKRIYEAPRGVTLWRWGMARKYAYVLRTCSADMRSYNGFIWPKKGKVECNDWRPTAQCGNGLHGLLNGAGDGTLLDWDESAKWLVVKVLADSVVEIGDKVKFPSGTVVFCGDRKGATDKIISLGADPALCVGGTATAGDGGTATAGYGGTATAGHRGTATAGHRGTATAGDGGTATAGYGGTATAGDGGTATAGDGGTATAGDGGTATAGHGGTATAGYGGTATAGHGGTATAGYGGTATAGDRGVIAISWYDSAKSKWRVAVGEVGENGIEPNRAYLVDGGRLVQKEEAA